MKKLTLLLLVFSEFTFANFVCEKNLEVLLISMSGNRSTQEAIISYPLKYTYIDTQSNDMDLVEKQLNEKEIKTAKLPVYPLKSTQKSHGLVHKVLEQNKESAKVLVFKPETDYSLTYHFRNTSGCWLLTEYNNDSL